MRETLGPPLRAAAFTALIVGLVVLVIDPPSLGGVDDLVVMLLGALAIVLVTAWVTVALIGRHQARVSSQGVPRPFSYVHILFL